MRWLNNEQTGLLCGNTTIIWHFDRDHEDRDSYGIDGDRGWVESRDKSRLCLLIYIPTNIAFLYAR
jgi:hypothetical protein